MFKKIISIILSLLIAINNVSKPTGENIRDDNADIANRIAAYESLLEDEKILSTATLEDNFCDNSLIAIYTKSASRHNRTFTRNDFAEIGAVEITDIVLGAISQTS